MQMYNKIEGSVLSLSVEWIKPRQSVYMNQLSQLLKNKNGYSQVSAMNVQYECAEVTI